MKIVLSIIGIIILIIIIIFLYSSLVVASIADRYK